MTRTTKDPSPLGVALEAHRKAAGWSRETLAREAGLSYATVMNVERYRQVPTTDTLRSFATALSLPFADLLDLEAS